MVSIIPHRNYSNIEYPCTKDLMESYTDKEVDKINQYLLKAVQSETVRLNDVINDSANYNFARRNDSMLPLCKNQYLRLYESLSSVKHRLYYYNRPEWASIPNTAVVEH